MNFINRETAKKEILNILKTSNPIKTGLTLPIRPNETFNVYSIPLDFLAPNVLNDRIAWRIREFESTNGRKLSSDNEDDVELVYTFIEKETPDANKNTLKDIAEKGQQLDGIITQNGIIIDGNRRATLLRKLFNGDAKKFNKRIDDFRFFKAIVLPGDFTDKEILALETMIQIREDKKVDYNPICMYIKVDNLSKAGYNDRQIAMYMGCKEKEVKDRKEVFNLMNEYLSSINKENHYTLLEGLEDQFLSTKSVFKKLDNGTYSTAWEYSDQDVADFKQVCFDYLRSKFEGKKYRDILVGKANKTNGVFINETVWKEFLNHHNEIIDKNLPQSEDDWKMLGHKQFAQNLDNASRQLSDTINNKNVSSLIASLKAKAKTLEDSLKQNWTLSNDDCDSLIDAYKIILKLVNKQWQK